MASYDYWSCSNCDFSGATVPGSGRYIVNPKSGVVPSKIDYRWCSDCNGIKVIFLAEAPELSYLLYSTTTNHRDPLKRLHEVKAEIEELEKIKSSKFLFRLSKQSKQLKFLKEKYLSWLKDQKERDAIWIKRKEHYASKKLKPKCLICGGINVSDRNWDKDTHICGGKFKQKYIDHWEVHTMRGDVRIINYDENGNAESHLSDDYDDRIAILKNSLKG